MNILSRDFVEFIEFCVAPEVKFLIVGGYALAAHGHPAPRWVCTSGCGFNVQYDLETIGSR